MKKIISSILAVAMLAGTGTYSVYAENVNVSDKAESFETNTAQNAEESFLSDFCSVEMKTDSYIATTNDYRKTDGKNSLKISRQNGADIEIKTVFDSLSEIPNINNATVLMQIYAEEMSTGESSVKLPVVVSVADKDSNIIAQEKTEITSDESFNTPVEGFAEVKLNFPFASASIFKGAKLILSVGDEEAFPKTVYIDELSVKGNFDKELEEEKDVEPPVIDLMRNLGISNILTTSGYISDKTVTRADFAAILAGFLGTRNAIKTDTEVKFDDVYKVHYAYDSIKLVSDMGIMNGTSEATFDTEGEITYVQALTSLVRALGYQQMADREGGYPLGYYKVAVDKDLDIGSIDANALVTQEIMCRLIENFIEAEFAVYDTKYENSHVTVNYGDNEGETVLTEYFDVEQGKGILTATKFASIENAAVGKDVVVINGEKYNCKPTLNTYDLLGREVNFYYQENELIYVSPTDRNNTVTVIPNDYDTINGSMLSYYDADGKRETVDIFNLITIYNGEKKAFSKTMLDNFNAGRLIFVDNDNDDEYEILFIENSEYYIANVVNATELTISDKYSRPTLRLKEYGQYMILDEEGRMLDVKDISAGDVIEVMKSSDNSKNFVKMIVGGRTASGRVEAVGENEVTVDGVKYTVSENANYFISKKYISKLRASSMITLYIANNEVIAWDIGVSDSWNIGYIKNAYALESGEGGGYRILTEYGELEDFESDTKIIIDGTKTTVGSDLFNQKMKESGRAKEQLVRYKLGTDGRLMSIETAEEYVEGQTVLEKDKLIKISDGLPGYYLRNGLHYFTDGRDAKNGYDFYTDNKLYYIPETSKTFQMPAEGSRYEANPKFYKVLDRAAMGTISGQSPEAYIINGIYNSVDYFVVKSDRASTESVNYFKARVAIVTDVVTAVNEDNEIGLKVTCMKNNAMEEFFGDISNIPETTDEAYYDHTRLSPGDLIIYEPDDGGVVDMYNKSDQFYYLLDMDESTKKFKMVYPGISEDQYAYMGRIAGQKGGWFNALMRVYDVRDGYVFLNYNENLASKDTNRIYPYSSFTTWVFNREKGTIRKGDVTEAKTYLNDTTDASEIYVSVFDGKAVSMILFE